MVNSLWKLFQEQVSKNRNRHGFKKEKEDRGYRNKKSPQKKIKPLSHKRNIWKWNFAKNIVSMQRSMLSHAKLQQNVLNPKTNKNSLLIPPCALVLNSHWYCHIPLPKMSQGLLEEKYSSLSLYYAMTVLTLWTFSGTLVSLQLLWCLCH